MQLPCQHAWREETNAQDPRMQIYKAIPSERTIEKKKFNYVTCSQLKLISEMEEK